VTTRVRIECPAGAIIGTAGGSVARFLGIPFAEAPAGSLRFQPPVTGRRFAEPFDASAWGATPQRGTPHAFTTIPEPSIPGDDVLTLNVFTPEPPPAQGSLPVLVWIHGGGYVTGSAASAWYDGSSFAEQGIVFVSLAYRLGLEGFGVVGGSSNRGLQDWLAALTWVRDNIHAFGGDPARVTVAGQSAGGGAVLSLLACPAAQPLFSRGVAISPVDLSIPLDRATQFTEEVAAELGVANSAAGFAEVDGEHLQRVVLHRVQTPADDSPLVLAPTHGDALLPSPVRSGLATHGVDKPLLLGSTADEVDSPGFHEAVTGRAAPSGPAPFPRTTDSLFRATCVRTARTRALGQGGTWLYSFDWVSPVLRGAAHCIDIPFFFGRPDVAESVLGPDTPPGLVRAAHGDLVAFVRGDQPYWARAVGALGDAAMVYAAVTDPAGRPVDGGSAVVHGSYDDVVCLVDAEQGD
jgi:para-nitrobenzyl esterase